jgi:hypothetical protein
LPQFWSELNAEKASLLNIQICGLMGMASLTEDPVQISNEFSQIQKLFLEAKSTIFNHSPSFCELSIGMSSDYHIATEHGSTFVRVGTAVFV